MELKVGDTIQLTGMDYFIWRGAKFKVIKNSKHRQYTLMLIENHNSQVKGWISEWRDTRLTGESYKILTNQRRSHFPEWF